MGRARSPSRRSTQTPTQRHSSPPRRSSNHRNNSNDRHVTHTNIHQIRLKHRPTDRTLANNICENISKAVNLASKLHFKNKFQFVDRNQQFQLVVVMMITSHHITSKTRSRRLAHPSASIRQRSVVGVAHGDGVWPRSVSGEALQVAVSVLPHHAHLSPGRSSSSRSSRTSRKTKQDQEQQQEEP